MVVCVIISEWQIYWCVLTVQTQARSTLSSTAQNAQCMTSKYRESDKRADGSYAFEWLSRYFDFIHWPFCAAPLKFECAYWHDWEQTWEVTGLGCCKVKNSKSQFLFSSLSQKIYKSHSNNEKVAKFGDRIPKLATCRWLSVTARSLAPTGGAEGEGPCDSFALHCTQGSPSLSVFDDTKKRCIPQKRYDGTFLWFWNRDFSKPRYTLKPVIIPCLIKGIVHPKKYSLIIYYSPSIYKPV